MSSPVFEGLRQQADGWQKNKNESASAYFLFRYLLARVGLTGATSHHHFPAIGGFEPCEDFPDGCFLMGPWFAG